MKANKSDLNHTRHNRLNDLDRVSPKETIRVLTVDDDWIILKGLKVVLTEHSNIKIVGSASNGKEAIEQVAQFKPDVVILDLIMPLMGGIEATKKIKKQFPGIKIIILSSFEDDATIAEVVAAGASGYLLKSLISDNLVQVVRSVYGGSYHFAHGIMDKLVLAAQEGFSSRHATESSVNTNKVSTTNSSSLTQNSPSQAQKVSKITKVKSPQQAKLIKAKTAEAKPLTVSNAPSKRAQKLRPEKNSPTLLDWLIAIISCVIFALVGSGSNYLGLGYIGLFILVMTLFAQAIGQWWNGSLNNFHLLITSMNMLTLFVAIIHVIYETRDFLLGNLESDFFLVTKNQLGIWVGISSLMLVAIAVNKSFQPYEPKNWRQRYWLTFFAVILTVLHTTLISQF